MPLVPCRYCGRRVSDHAHACPDCGGAYPGSAERERRGIVAALLFLAISIVLALAIG